MIKWIVKKDLISNIQDFRVLTFFILIVTLAVINAFVSSEGFHQELEAYSKSVAAHKSYENCNFDFVTVDKRPNPLSFITDGQTQRQDRSLEIHRTGEIQPAGTVYRENYLLQDFQFIDWMFIIKVPLSIFTILLTFDAICGEKEKRTLILICSNSVSRGNIILGKYLGAIITITLSLLTGILTDIVLISFLKKIDLDLQMFSRIGLIVLVSTLYISVFALLGLLISSITNRSSISLLLNLGVWLLLVVVIPTIAGIAGEHLSKTPRESEFAERQQEIYKIYRDPTYRQRLLQEIINNQRLAKVEDIQSEAVKLLIKTEDDKIKLSQDMWRAIESREDLARNLARMSPSTLYQFVCEFLAFTGVVAERSFYNSAQFFLDIYRDYIKEKTGVVYKYQLTPTPWEVEVQGKVISVSPPLQPGLPEGLKALPQFNKPFLSISESISHGSIDILFLILWNILLFLLSNMFFARYDVR